MRKKLGEHAIVDVDADYAAGMISTFAVPQWCVKDEPQFVTTADYGPVIRFRNNPRLFVVTQGAVYYHDPEVELKDMATDVVTVPSKRKREPIELTA